MFIFNSQVQGLLHWYYYYSHSRIITITLVLVQSQSCYYSDRSTTVTTPTSLIFSSVVVNPKSPETNSFNRDTSSSYNAFHFWSDL